MSTYGSSTWKTIAIVALCLLGLGAAFIGGPILTDLRASHGQGQTAQPPVPAAFTLTAKPTTLVKNSSNEFVLTLLVNEAFEIQSTNPVTWIRDWDTTPVVNTTGIKSSKGFSTAGTYTVSVTDGKTTDVVRIIVTDPNGNRSGGNPTAAPTSAPVPTMPPTAQPTTPPTAQPTTTTTPPTSAPALNELDWNTVVTDCSKVAGFTIGRPSANPGPCIEILDRMTAGKKTEVKTVTNWTLTGPALFWGGIYDVQTTKALLDKVHVISCQGSSDRLGTCILVIPANTTVTFHNTGAYIVLANFDSSQLPTNGPAMTARQTETVSIPTQCVDPTLLKTALSLSAGQIRLLDEVSENNIMAKFSPRDHFATSYTFSVPSDKEVVFWTTGSVNNAKIIATDPGVASIYLAAAGQTITVNGSFQAILLCSPLSSNPSGTNPDTIPVKEVIDALNAGTTADAMRDDFQTRYPGAVIKGDFADINGANMLIFGPKGLDSAQFMTVGKAGNLPYVNLQTAGSIPADATAFRMDKGLDPECDLSYWTATKPARCK
jgi:hypothetical protein